MYISVAVAPFDWEGHLPETARARSSKIELKFRGQICLLIAELRSGQLCGN